MRIQRMLRALTMSHDILTAADRIACTQRQAEIYETTATFEEGES